MNKKILMFAILGMFLFSFVSADTLQTSKLNEDFDFRVTCENIGYCDNLTICNINIETPNNTLLVANQDMQHNPSYYNYTIKPDEVGIYSFTGFCRDGSLQEEIDYKLDVTFSGKQDNIWAYIITLSVSILMILGVVWLNRTYDRTLRRSLYKKLVLGFFDAKKKNSNTDFATMVMYSLGYGLLEYIFVLYYLSILIFLFIFKDLAVTFGINGLSATLPPLLVVWLWGLIVVGVYWFLKLTTVAVSVIEDIKDGMRSGFDE